MATASEVEVIIWDPVGFGESSFGHASVVIRRGTTATSYSLGPRGCDIKAFDRYLAQQDFRNGYGLVLRLDERQTTVVVAYFEASMACEYRFLDRNSEHVNNCTTPIQRALARAGVTLNGFSIMPRALGLNLWNRSLVGTVRAYRGSHVGHPLFHPPWITPSSAYPWAQQR
jgi:hypothetical protein